MKKWTCSFYFTFIEGGMKFSTELDYIYANLDENLTMTDVEFYMSGIISKLYKFESIEPQLNMYCYECRESN